VPAADDDAVAGADRFFTEH